MSQQITSRSEIPDAPYYVLANDTFMSGWGPAQGKTNTVILPCQSWSEAQYVESYATFQRTDMQRVRIVVHKPRLNNATHLYSLMDRNEAASWYPKR
jgi:hypothetical protein